jgi:hypothetical protein
VDNGPDQVSHTKRKPNKKNFNIIILCYSSLCMFDWLRRSFFLLSSLFFLWFFFFICLTFDHHYSLRPGVKASLIPGNLSDGLRKPACAYALLLFSLGILFTLIYILYKAMKVCPSLLLWVYTTVAATSNYCLQRVLNY